MEIKVGDYVRTKEWGIAKVNKLDNGKVTFVKNKNNRTTHYFTQLKEPSSNIIDLIEVGDYVNGKKIERINDYGDFKRADFNLDYDDCDAVYNESIKSIVTKEQFSSLEYKI